MNLRAQLETARLVLRPLAALDAAAVISAVNDLTVSRWLSSVPHPYGLADFRHFLTQIARPGLTFVIEDDAGFAGIIGTEREFGYWLAPRAWGKGYATEAARAVLLARFAADQTVLLAGYFSGNDQSARVLQKLGFVETGRGMRFAKSLGQEVASVEMRLTLPGFRATLPAAATSARLSYRAMQSIDADELHQIVQHRDVTRQLGPKWPWPADPAFTATRAQPFGGNGFSWAIFLGPRLIGTVAVTNGELGYMLHPEFWRQGMVIEACRNALDHAFRAPDLVVVRASVWADNLASQAVLNRLGFRQTGEHIAQSPSRPGGNPGYDLQLSRQAWLGA